MGVDLGRICGVTFGDVAGSFLVGLLLGALLLWLAQQAFKRGNHD